MTGTCSVAVRRTESGYLLRITGRGTSRESPVLRGFVAGVMDDGADVVLDLTACEHLDSTFLGCLVILHQHAENGSGSFAVRVDDSARERLLQNVRLHRFFTFADTTPACLGDSVSLPVADFSTSEFGRHLLETHSKLADLGGPAAETFRAIAAQLARELNDFSPPASGHEV